MIQINKKEECCGCYGCSNVCPKKCISMKIDEEGFWYPEVDKSKCINCDLCIKVCPVISSIKKYYFKPIAYACKNKAEEVRLSSSSGGVFTVLCEEVINDNGVVFGAAFDDELNIKHSFAENLEECKRFRGSKYVQSEIGDMYSKAKEFLDKGRKVLFSGTQCQIKGLNLFLRKVYDNLITVDVICHGVPSPKVFNQYKESLVKSFKGEIKSINFRDKRKGWKSSSFVSEFNNDKEYSANLNEDIYMKGFLRNIYLRPSCYNCKAKNYSDGSDLSLGDYWGIENIHPEFDDDKGASIVSLNSEKGSKIFNKISNKIEFLETDLDYATKCNPCIVKSVQYNPKRERFFNELKEDNFESLVIKYSKISIIKKFKSIVRIVLGKFKRRLIK